MRYNGLQLIIDMAVRKLNLPELNRYRDALVLGAIREDVRYLPRKRMIWEHWSLSHFSGTVLGGGFIPFLTRGAPQQAQRYFDGALNAARAGQQARAFVLLGMASHLLIDMACPVHARRVAHWTDGYEWYIEANCASLAALPFALADRSRSARHTVAALAKFTQQFDADGTHHHLGLLLKWLGMRRTLPRTLLHEQASKIVPVAAGHLAALYLHFLDTVRAA
ncbi:MAG: zinc dependent phospholipase C family protein [Pseudomonadota bacterium]